MAQQVAGEVERQKDDILHLAVETACALAAHRHRHLAQQVEGDRDVVGGDAPQRVDVALDAAEVDALAVEVEDVAEIAAVDRVFDVADGRVELKHVAHHEDRAEAVRQRE